VSHETVQDERYYPFYRDTALVPRKYGRRGVSDLTCDITDGALAYGCQVENISLGGFKLVDVPLAFHGYKHTYAILITSGKESYRIIAKPCWQKQDGQLQRQNIGFKILESSLEWVSYAMDVAREGESKKTAEVYH